MKKLDQAVAIGLAYIMFAHTFSGAQKADGVSYDVAIGPIYEVVETTTNTTTNTTTDTTTTTSTSTTTTTQSSYEVTTTETTTSYTTLPTATTTTELTTTEPITTTESESATTFPSTSKATSTSKTTEETTIVTTETKEETEEAVVTTSDHDYYDIPITESERIMLTNLVAHEYGANWISEYEKAKIVMVVMNRVNSKKFPNTIHKVILQKGQFCNMPDDHYIKKVTDSCIEAVYYYFNHIDSYATNLYFYYGDGWCNYFRTNP